MNKTSGMACITESLLQLDLNSKVGKKSLVSELLFQLQIFSISVIVFMLK